MSNSEVMREFFSQWPKENVFFSQDNRAPYGLLKRLTAQLRVDLADETLQSDNGTSKLDYTEIFSMAWPGIRLFENGEDGVISAETIGQL